MNTDLLYIFENDERCTVVSVKETC